MRRVLIIAGTPIDDLTTDEALRRIEEFVALGRATGKPHQVATVNVDFVVKALADPELRGILQEADLATADGMPLVWSARLLGVPLQGRVTGADLVPALAELAARKGFSLYFLGGNPGVAARAAEVLQQRHPGLRVAGIAVPPRRSVLEMDPSYVAQIRAARPDILLVAFGNPKQEKWIAMHARELGVPVCMGVGGTFDFIAGTTRRAPVWMQRAGLEWSFRLLQEPHRLWRRYIADLGYGYAFLRQWWAMRAARRAPATLPTGETVLIDGVAVVSLKGRLDTSNSAAVAARLEEALGASRYVTLNLAGVDFMDSAVIGTLVAFTKRTREQGGDLTLVGVSAPVLKVLRLLHLDTFLEIRTDLTVPPTRRTAEDHTLPTPQAGWEGWAVLQVPRRLDALTAPAFAAAAAERLAATPRLVLDFSETVFLASAGIALLLRLNREAAELGGKLRLDGCSDDVRRVIRVFRLEGVLTYSPNAGRRTALQRLMRSAA